MIHRFNADERDSRRGGGNGGRRGDVLEGAVELDSGSGQTESDRDVPREGAGGRSERGDKMAGGQRRGQLLFVCLLSMAKRKIIVYILTFFLCSMFSDGGTYWKPFLFPLHNFCEFYRLP